MFYCDYASDYQYGYVLPPPAPPSAKEPESTPEEADLDHPAHEKK